MTEAERRAAVLESVAQLAHAGHRVACTGGSAHSQIAAVVEHRAGDVVIVRPRGGDESLELVAPGLPAEIAPGAPVILTRRGSGYQLRHAIRGRG